MTTQRAPAKKASSSKATKSRASATNTAKKAAKKVKAAAKKVAKAPVARKVAKVAKAAGRKVAKASAAKKVAKAAGRNVAKAPAAKRVASTPAGNLIARFDSMVDALRRDPEIDVLHYLVRPPNPSEIEEVERALGYSLGAAITGFYEACGGIQLLWIRKDHEEYEERARRVRAEVERSGGSFDEGWFYGDNEGDAMHPDGVILIPSIKRAFLDSSFNNNNNPKPSDPEAVFYRGFEMFYPTVNVAFALNGRPDPVLTAAYDRYEYDDSAHIHLREYLELLLVSRGLARRAFGFLLDNMGKVITLEDVEQWAPEE